MFFLISYPSNIDVINLWRKKYLIFIFIFFTSGSYKNAVPKNADDAILNQDEKQKLVPIPKTFTGVEVFDGKAVGYHEQ